jgi:hypothetical protein
MKSLLLVLLMAALLAACLPGGAVPVQYPCPRGQYWSTTSQACQEYPRGADRSPVDGGLKMAVK